jgi:type II secretory pathway component PulM
MERMELEELVQNLQQRAERLERRQRHLLAGALLLAVVFLAGWQQVQPPQENFKTHALSIVRFASI